MSCQDLSLVWILNSKPLFYRYASKFKRWNVEAQAQLDSKSRYLVLDLTYHINLRSTNSRLFTRFKIPVMLLVAVWIRTLRKWKAPLERSAVPVKSRRNSQTAISHDHITWPSHKTSSPTTPPSYVILKRVRRAHRRCRHRWLFSRPWTIHHPSLKTTPNMSTRTLALWARLSASSYSPGASQLCGNRGSRCVREESTLYVWKGIV